MQNNRRRGHNEGTIFEESPGRWVASISLGYEVRDGKRRRVRKKFIAETRREVQQRLTAALREHQTGGIVARDKESLGEYMTAWLDGLGARGRRAKTVDSYRWMFQAHIQPEIGKLRLARLTQRDLNDWMQRKMESGCSARTVRYAHAIVRSALTTAEKAGAVARNVAKLAEPPAAATGAIEPLSADEARRFLAAVSGHRLEALYSVAIAIGLRRGEALGLEWKGIDLDRGTLSVTQTIQRISRKGMVRSKAGKTDTSIRMIPLPAFAVAALRAHLERQATERSFAGNKWQESGLVFTSSIGTPLEPSNLLKHFHNTLDIVKIDRRRFHDLRHTAASLLLAQGATLHEVKEILGHSQIALTANLYGHAYTSVLRGTVDRVGNLLAPQNGLAPQLAPQPEPSKVN